LLTRLPTPLLRLQLVKRLAEASGFAQAEVERLCDLKSVVAAPPPRVPRAAPSLGRGLLRLILQRPELAARLPLDLLGELPERDLLRRLAAEASDGADSYAALRERLRGDPEESALDQAAAEALGTPFDAGEAETEFSDVLDKLSEGAQRRAFAALQAKVQRLGVTGLSTEEKQEYLRLLSNPGKRG
ncbi:MAG TPA: DNA primase, partial [Rhodocyclaceae bacterium]|nr:DNA primase [Rhodocyclaceae bacterium]